MSVLLHSKFVSFSCYSPMQIRRGQGSTWPFRVSGLFLQGFPHLPGPQGPPSGFCAYSQQAMKDKVKEHVGSFIGTRPESDHILLARAQSPGPTQLKGRLENWTQREKNTGFDGIFSLWWGEGRKSIQIWTKMPLAKSLSAAILLGGKLSWTWIINQLRMSYHEYLSLALPNMEW